MRLEVNCRGKNIRFCTGVVFVSEGLCGKGNYQKPEMLIQRRDVNKGFGVLPGVKAGFSCIINGNRKGVQIIFVYKIGLAVMRCSNRPGQCWALVCC